MKKLLLLISHLIVFIFGFVLGIYLLPILTAPNAPTETEVSAISDKAKYMAEFKKDLKGSDVFHWGDGIVSIGEDAITLMGKLSPGPDYKLYLSPVFVEDEASFESNKPSMVVAGEIKTFDNFIITVPGDIDIGSYNTVVIWCESFDEFITSAQYRN